MKINIVRLGVYCFFVFIIGLLVYTFCEGISEKNPETKIVDVSESDIIIADDDFYVIDPDGDRIPLGIDGGEVLDLTKHSRVLIKFIRYPAFGIYLGSGWFVDGVVKTPNP